jgi:hypothetical protein
MKFCAFQHTCVGVELGLVQVLDDVLDRLDRSIPDYSSASPSSRTDSQFVNSRTSAR